ncbi:hypothetical protein FB567DRAFT_350997 [Paraphoma chrysanthemicola]|uniref:Uncharacterized protein n=1 Tax=Paraphoma chrysanthemicola TaxID=798071 RepID=A0A8K0R4U8_9PLEO|nr:hypothetical protein FB567DRAFT_350997 [Paraphoma chrysanthemicola]
MGTEQLCLSLKLHHYLPTYVRTTAIVPGRESCRSSRFTCPVHHLALPGVANFSDQPTPLVKTQVACFDSQAGLCLLVDAAVATITSPPLIIAPGPAYLHILVALQFADAAILIPTIRLPTSWTTFWYRTFTWPRARPRSSLRLYSSTRTCLVLLPYPSIVLQSSSHQIHRLGKSHGQISNIGLAKAEDPIREGSSLSIFCPALHPVLLRPKQRDILTFISTWIPASYRYTRTTNI